jgi:DNA-directed RNA polymerase specialized sigma24 family protein
MARALLLGGLRPAGRVALSASGLTREGFELLLARLHPERERAGERYELLRAKLLKFFEYRGCAAAEQAADETVNRVARRLEGGEAIRAEDATAYFVGVARNVLREYWARPERSWRPIDDTSPADLAAPEGPPDDAEGERLWACFDRCLGALDPRQRELVLEYYEWGRRQRIDSRKDLCRRLGLTMNAVRIRAHRIRESLERCVKRCAGGGEMEPASVPHPGEADHRG